VILTLTLIYIYFDMFEKKITGYLKPLEFTLTMFKSEMPHISHFLYYTTYNYKPRNEHNQTNHE